MKEMGNLPGTMVLSPSTWTLPPADDGLESYVDRHPILVVARDPNELLAIQARLCESFFRRSLSTVDHRRALSMLKSEKPGLLILHLSMQDCDGLELMRRKAADDSLRHIPVLAMISQEDEEVREAALELGAFDLVMAPFDVIECRTRVRNALMMQVQRERISDASRTLRPGGECLVDILASRRQLILSLVNLAEQGDADTVNHVLRVGRYAAVIARQLGWSSARAEMLELAAQLHDVGKVAIPREILLKPAGLDLQELTRMRTHCVVGKEILDPPPQDETPHWNMEPRRTGESWNHRCPPVMRMAARIAYSHHERWDGTGYPLGLAGEEIPIEGRITAVADVFDALCCERPYKKALPRQKAFQIIRESSGSHFDPQVVEAFLAQAEQITQEQIGLTDTIAE